MAYVKLDTDWRDDPKVALLRERHGCKAEFAWMNMIIVMFVCDGVFDANSKHAMAIAKRYMRTTEKKIRQYIEWFAECDLIDAEVYATHAHVTSTRAEREQRARKGRQRFRQAGSSSRAMREAQPIPC